MSDEKSYSKNKKHMKERKGKYKERVDRIRRLVTGEKLKHRLEKALCLSGWV